MPLLSRLLFGNITFSQSEELIEFRYKFLIVLMLSGSLFTLLFVAGEFAQINRIQTPHFVSMQAFSAIAIALWLILRGRKQVFIQIAWVYELVCLCEYTSALWLVPADELRVMWFFVNIPGVFIMLGASAGWGITVITVVWLHISNAYIPNPYSSNAMATATVSMLYLGVFFHSYGARALSYFARMQTYNESLEQLATYDTLTGALNARAYYAICDKNIHNAQRSKAPYSVLFIDLDHFKRVNDTYGHSAGDVVLKSVTVCIDSAIRRSDSLGRIGGEEFSVFLPNTGKEGAQHIAEAVRQAIEALNPDIGDLRLPVTASIGYATCDEEIVPMDVIQKRADEAMYLAKSLGRNRVSSLG